MIEQLSHTVTLTLTENCNLSCSYCYEHSKSPRMMKIDIAKATVDKELSKTEPDREIEFDFFGAIDNLI